jgi:hypothetical protein
MLTTPTLVEALRRARNQHWNNLEWHISSEAIPALSHLRDAVIGYVFEDTQPPRLMGYPVEIVKTENWLHAFTIVLLSNSHPDRAWGIDLAGEIFEIERSS